jgi:hypothetical protein
MNTIWCFGDSFTYGDGCKPEDEFYKKYKKEGDKIWTDWIYEWYDVNVVNIGRKGASNDMILDSIIFKFEEFKKGDCVIIGKTLSGRFDVPYKNKNGEKVLVPVFAHFLMYNISEITDSYSEDEMKTILNFQYYFSSNELYTKRQNDRYNFIIKILKEKKINVIFWNWDEIHKQYEKIDKASDFTILDGHWSFEGHKTFAIYLVTKFFNNLTEYKIKNVDFKNNKTLM